MIYLVVEVREWNNFDITTTQHIVHINNNSDMKDVKVFAENFFSPNNWGIAYIIEVSNNVKNTLAEKRFAKNSKSSWIDFDFF